MYKNDIINLLNKQLDLTDKITEKQLDTLMLDVTRVVDTKITESINEIRHKTGYNFNSIKRESIRLAFLGYPVEIENDIANYRPVITDEEMQMGYELLNDGFMRNKDVMIKSVIARYKKHFSNELDLSAKYLNYIEEKQKDNHQLLILKINAQDQLNTNDIVKTVSKKYDQLSNYHNAVIIFEDCDDHVISWETIAEVCVYLENFKKEDQFSAFNRNKQKRVGETKEFINNHNLISNPHLLDEKVEQFYEAVCYGFQFLDLFITDDGLRKILVMQKVELDEDPIPCPSCFQKIVRGNSYPKILYKSFECTNPECPSRSKIGRGKRYDYFSCKRQIMLERDNDKDYINEAITHKYRRDIIPDFNEGSVKDLISLYSWSGDSVLLINLEQALESKYLDRHINYESVVKSTAKTNPINELPIVKLLKTITSHICYESVKENLTVNYETIDHDVVINGNSSKYAPFISKMIGVNNIGGAVTSPPYFNAREYSQWPNLLTYFIDMMINANSVYKILKENGTYVYNIGDVVGQDNIYIASNMSRRRQILGFYTIIVFNLIGYRVKTNIIWDKGEVQSKRNSSANRFPGYVKPINAYEHDFVFVKELETPLTHTEVRKIDTVKKINSKGENKLGHTAPYPIEIAELILPYVKDQDDYILDPFLGSGTTIIAANKNMRKAIGFELNEQYYELSINRIKQFRNQAEQLSLL